MGSLPPTEVPNFLRNFQRLVARILVFPMITVAALNGHCYAGGAMLSMGCDYRIMRQDRGFWCMPEIDLTMPLSPGMNAVIRCRIADIGLFRDIILLGKKYGGADAAKLTIVDQAVDEKAIPTVAMDLATAGAQKDRRTLGALKREMFREVHGKLVQEDLVEANYSLKSKL
eukprot:TRINITY_DN4182_c0_g1_i5.p1 TRINITY_DN4182_c0_g1~~TRINITY_DN4182_c0_g1_i5.p1  ORF type:complete len:171 (+),score=17.59 TRINITY_DN4182_c0_g1_i5:418-930(+)